MANEIWRLLEVTHEGTNQVKESKINKLVHGYELFAMKDNELIVKMFTRFIDIIIGLKPWERPTKKSEKVMKILRSFPKKWEIKVTTIQEAKDLTKLPSEELIRSLMTQEITMTSRQDVEDEKKKSIAFKVSINDKEEVEEEINENEEDGGLALIIRKFKKFMKDKRFKGRRFTSRKESQKKEASLNVDKEKNDIICYKCKKLRHIKYDCPLYKSKAKKGKNKAMVAT